MKISYDKPTDSLYRIAISPRTMLLLWVAVAALVTNISLSIALVPHYGSGGAAIANALAFLVFFVARTEASVRVWRQFPRCKMYLFVFTAVALSVLTVLFAPLVPFHFSLAWAALMPMVFWVFRKQWRDMHELVRGRRHAIAQ